MSILGIDLTAYSDLIWAVISMVAVIIMNRYGIKLPYQPAPSPVPPTPKPEPVPTPVPVPSPLAPLTPFPLDLSKLLSGFPLLSLALPYLLRLLKVPGVSEEVNPIHDSMAVSSIAHIFKSDEGAKAALLKELGAEEKK